jgi:cation transport ATPase
MKNILLIVIAAVYLLLCIDSSTQVNKLISPLMLSPILVIATIAFAPHVFPLKEKKWVPYLLAYIFSFFLGGLPFVSSHIKPELAHTFSVVNFVALAIGGLILWWYNKSTEEREKPLVMRHAVVFFVGASMLNLFYSITY